MRRVTVLALVALALVGIGSPVALAQTTCTPFSALLQGRIVLDPDVSLPPVLAVHQDEFGWGGTVFGLVGGQKEYLGGWFYGKDDAKAPTYSRANGRGRNGVYMFAFGTRDDQGVFTVTDTFDLQLGQAVWTVDAHAIGYTGNYKASGTLANGTGLFEGATGNFTLHGDFAVWDVDGALVSVWNPRLKGTICR